VNKDTFNGLLTKEREDGREKQRDNERKEEESKNMFYLVMMLIVYVGLICKF
jgi:hypothetical protein